MPEPIEKSTLHYKSPNGDVHVTLIVYEPTKGVLLVVLEDDSDRHHGMSVTNSIEQACDQALLYLFATRPGTRAYVFAERYPHCDPDRIDLVEFSISRQLVDFGDNEICKATMNSSPMVHPKWQQRCLHVLFDELTQVAL